MRGTLVYADTFWALDFVGLRGDRLAEATRGWATAQLVARKASPGCVASG